MLVVILLLAAAFFLPAGTILYWEAWIYLAILCLPMLLLLAYLIRTDPELLERRMRLREKESEQKRIVALSSAYFLAAFLLPGFDKRYGWSSVPAAAVIAADLVVLLGFALFALVLRENSYASRVIEVEPDQRLVSTGPYAVVRHPMYVAVLLIYIPSPLALGSWWAMIPTLCLPFLLIARIRNEEHVLTRELEGYREYKQKVRFRLIPGVW